MKVFFLLSGEHETLPQAEALAVMKAEGISFQETDLFEQVLVGECDSMDGVGKRLAMSHLICDYLGSCASDDGSIMDMVGETAFSAERFAVRVRRINEYFKEISTEDLERRIGALIWEKTGAKVDLTNPKDTFYGVLSERFIIGRVMARVDRSSYEARRPHKRPYFRPGSILPRMARALVNLTGIREGETIIDPFCGTGGFLMEAGLMGMKVHGNDIEKEFVKGCETNLNHYGITDYHLTTMDARDLPQEYPESFDAVVADPPYGIQASTRGKSLDDVYGGALDAIYKILKPRKKAVVISPWTVPMEDFATGVGFKVLQTHSERIHRSLTRRIVVMEKG